MTADEEEGMTIAQANSPIDAEGYFTNEHVACRRGHDVLEAVSYTHLAWALKSLTNKRTTCA